MLCSVLSGFFMIKGVNVNSLYSYLMYYTIDFWEMIV